VTLSSSQDDTAYTSVAGSNTTFATPAPTDIGAFTLTSASATLSGLAIAPGAYAYLRWSGSSSGSGARDEIGLDDISLNNFVLGVAPNDLTWNSFPGGIWNTTPANQPWLRNGNPSAFAPGDNVSFNNPAGAASVAIDAAGVTPASIVINNSSNSYAFSGGSIHSSAQLIKNNAGTVTFANANRWAGAIVNAGTVVIAQSGSATGVQKISGALTIASGARLDLKDNHLIVTATPAGTWNGSIYTGIAGLIASGRNGNALPLWDGSGIVTSMTAATSGNYTTLAVARASDIGITATALWAGQTVSSSDTLIMYTYGGDANLDGKINILDYVQIDQGINAGLKGWVNGDFNYDGLINILDYASIIDSNITNQGAAFYAAGSTSLTTAVPEPAMGCWMAIGAVALARRARSRRARHITR
jgi:hypothetical protein